MRKCYICKTKKHLDEFPMGGNGKKDYRCLPCSRMRNKEYRDSEAGKRKRRDSRYRRVYGISLEDFEVLLDRQGGVCQICKRSPGCQDKEFAVDHCHETGRVRGVLCDRCNRALGAVEDDTDLLECMIKYVSTGLAT